MESLAHFGSNNSIELPPHSLMGTLRGDQHLSRRETHSFIIPPFALWQLGRRSHGMVKMAMEYSSRVRSGIQSKLRVKSKTRRKVLVSGGVRKRWIVKPAKIFFGDSPGPKSIPGGHFRNFQFLKFFRERPFFPGNPNFPKIFRRPYRIYRAQLGQNHKSMIWTSSGQLFPVLRKLVYL